MTRLRMMMMAAALAACALLGWSCGGPARRVEVESVDSVKPAGWSGVSIWLTVRNDMRREIVLESCRLVFSGDSGELAGADLRSPAAVAARTTSAVRLMFKVTSVSPSLFRYLWRRVVSGRADEVWVDVDAVVRIGGRERRICLRKQQLSKILCNFGVAENDFATWAI